jgi:flavin reductase (DIM6/NTAB) family NADH-FMN oxidoreductase RutF
MLSFDTNGEFKDNYKYLIGSILPRPIAWVSTLNKDGSNNLAPFSFFTGVSSKPMVVAFCPVIRPSTGEKKDTVVNIEREKECVINFVTESLADQCNLSSTELPYGEDEFLHSGLTPLDSELVKARRVKESPIQFECKLRDILSYGNEPGAGSLIAVEVLKVHVDESIYDQGRIITSKYQPIGRGAGNDWIKCDSIVQKERLMKAQIQK